MSREEIRVSDYIVVCISEFAQRHGLHMRDAYTYLERYRGIAFLKEFYDVEHTLSFDDVMQDISTICERNGGALA